MTLNANTIRELLDQATPAPWEWWGNDLVGSAGAGVLEFRVDCGAFCQGGMVTHDYTSKLEYDQKLIELAPELAAEYLRLRRELADFRAVLQDGATNPELFAIDHSWCEAVRDKIDRILNGDTHD